MTVFESVLANPVTNRRLTELLKKAAEGGEAQAEDAPAPFNSLYGTIRMAVNRLRGNRRMQTFFSDDDLINSDPRPDGRFIIEKLL